jgi:hypothetical protein
MFSAPFIQSADRTAAGVNLNKLPNHVFWGIVIRRSRVGLSDLRGVDGQELRASSWPRFAHAIRIFGARSLSLRWRA